MVCSIYIFNMIKNCVLFVILLNSQARCEQKAGDLSVAISDTIKPVICTVNLGEKGTDGLAGLRGPKGEVGTKGEKGTDGLAGVQGAKGEMGTKGEKGTDRLAGVQGPKGEMGTKGEKGTDGLAGVQGPKGEMGTKGEKGTEGSAGVQGLKGEMGTKGDRGEPGTKGLPGSQGESGRDGEKGTVGLTGPKGSEGEMGSKGDRGEPGPLGPPGSKGESGRDGAPGNPGTCACPPAEEFGVFDEKEEWGTEAAPANTTCRYAPKRVREKGEKKVLVYLDITSYDCPNLKVFCDFESMYTCIAFENPGDEISYTDNKPFWLSAKNKTMNADTIYKVQSDQLSWLHRLSFAANSKIRYHCKNSIPYRGPGKADDALMLLTWNGEKVGPEPTASTSFTYTVENDGCVNATKDTWSYTDIVLISGYNQRLPIIDFYIQDVRDSDQAFRIEILELCFG